MRSKTREFGFFGRRPRHQSTSHQPRGRCHPPRNRAKTRFFTKPPSRSPDDGDGWCGRHDRYTPPGTPHRMARGHGLEQPRPRAGTAHPTRGSAPRSAAPAHDRAARMAGPGRGGPNSRRFLFLRPPPKHHPASCASSRSLGNTGCFLGRHPVLRKKKPPPPPPAAVGVVRRDPWRCSRSWLHAAGLPGPLAGPSARTPTRQKCRKNLRGSTGFPGKSANKPVPVARIPENSRVPEMDRHAAFEVKTIVRPTPLPIGQVTTPPTRPHRARDGKKKQPTSPRPGGQPDDWPHPELRC